MQTDTAAALRWITDVPLLAVAARALIFGC